MNTATFDVMDIASMSTHQVKAFVGNLSKGEFDELASKVGHNAALLKKVTDAFLQANKCRRDGRDFGSVSSEQHKFDKSIRTQGITGKSRRKVA